jgi:hypothetical protein
MALTDFQEKFDNAYQETFQRTPVALKVMNTRFESDLKYGESIERFAFDVSGVRVRTVSRGSASTIDSITDTTQLLTINLEKEAVFHVSDGEVTQAGPLNPIENIAKEVSRKVALDLDARCWGEVVNAAFDFDNGDLTTLASTGTPITLSSTTVPQMTTRMGAKLLRRNSVEPTGNMVLVVDSYAMSDIDQFLISKNIDIAASTFQNGYQGLVRGASVYASENLTGEVVLTGSGTFSNGQTVVINGITFTAVSSIGSTAGNFLIGADLAASLTNLAGLINAPDTTSSTQVALASADAEVVSGKWTAVATTTTVTVVMVGSGRPIVSETAANASFTTTMFHAYYGKKGAIDLVVQDMKSTDMRKTDDRRGTNVFCSYLAGIKTFTDGSKKFLDVLIAA